MLTRQELSLEHLSIYLFRETLKFKIVGSSLAHLFQLQKICFNVENNANSDGKLLIISL